MSRRDRSARVLARARLWAPLVVVAAVPVSVLAAGGSSPVGGSGATLAAVSVPSDTSTTTGIGRSICHIVGTQACKDTPTTTSGTGTGTGTAAGTGTGTVTDTGTDSGTDTTTEAATSSAVSPPETGLCGNAKLPGVCSTRSASSTVTVQPPGSVSTTRAKSSKTTRATKTTKTRASKSASTVTVTVTRSGTASSQATTTTGTTP